MCGHDKGSTLANTEPREPHRTHARRHAHVSARPPLPRRTWPAACSSLCGSRCWATSSCTAAARRCVCACVTCPRGHGSCAGRSCVVRRTWSTPAWATTHAPFAPQGDGAGSVRVRLGWLFSGLFFFLVRALGRWGRLHTGGARHASTPPPASNAARGPAAHTWLWTACHVQLQLCCSHSLGRVSSRCALPPAAGHAVPVHERVQRRQAHVPGGRGVRVSAN